MALFQGFCEWVGVERSFPEHSRGGRGGDSGGCWHAQRIPLSGTPGISGRLFKDPRPGYQPPKGGSVSILFVAVVSLKK